MNKFFAVLALAVTVVSGQRASNGYGAPQQPSPSQPNYGNQGNQGGGQSLGQGQQSHGGDHQGLDWLLESVPGTPGTDYPIYTQEKLGGFFFDCNGQIEGGYYADTNAQCQAFHVCTPDGLGGLATQSFLCPNGTIFNQEYFICDWWFNFDCSQATGLYSRNEEVQAEREAASLAQASNNRPTFSNNRPSSQPANNNYSPAQPSNNNNFNNNNNNNFNNNNQQAPLSGYGAGKR